MSQSPPVPRRRRRALWIFLGGFLAAGVVFLGLLLAPPVQGWLLHRYVAAQPGWQLDFERIGVGPTGLDARGLAFAMPGVAASSAPLAIRVAPTRLFSKRELRVEQIEASKIRLTFTPAQRPPSSAPTATMSATATPFDGLLRLLQAPLPWALDAAQLDGEIAVRDAGESRLTGTFNLRGGGLSAATPGEFTYALSADSMILPPGPDHKFTSAGKVRVTQTATHGIARLSVEGDLHLPRYGELTLPAGQLHLDVAATPTGETYLAQLTLGTAAKLELEAGLDIAKSTLTGHVTFHADQSIAASLLGERLPRATADSTLTFALNLRNGDLDASIVGDLDARNWQKILPQLAALDAFKGRLTAALTRRGEQLTLKTLTATLHGENSPAQASITLIQPFDLQTPPATPVATIAFDHWPVEWANPFLSASGTQFAPAEFAAAWTFAAGPGSTFRFAPVRPATLGPITLKGTKRPSLPSVVFSFSPLLEISPAASSLTIADFTATMPQGDRLSAQLAVSRQTATGELRANGELHGTLPTLLGSTEAPQPMEFNASGRASVIGAQLQVTAFEFSARTTPEAKPCVEIALERPFDFDLEKHMASAPASASSPNTAATDWLHLHVDRFPLAWLSHWLPGRTVAGTFVGGESAVQPASEGGFALRTTAPWSFEHLAFASTGQAPFPLDVQLNPGVTVRGNTVVATLDALNLSDAAADRITGRIGVDVALAEKNFTADLALDASLPALPHSTETFGAISATLRAKFHNMSNRIVGADAFGLHVSNASGELLGLDAPQPFIFGLSNTDMIVVSTLAPLRLKLGGVPLAWLRPWSGALEVSGTLAPAEFDLSSSVTRYALRPVTPVKLENFSARQAGREFLREASVVLSPGVDLTFICVTQPTFQLAYTGTAHVTEATVDFAGRHALDLDVALGFKGNERTVLPDMMDLTSRADLSALPNAVAPGLPSHGLMVTRINGDLLGGQPVEAWTRLTGLLSPDAKETLPPLELTLRGKLSLDNVFAGGVELLLAAAPQSTDAKFDVRLNLLEGGLKITSALHSQFVDGAALLALARALSRPPATPAPKAVPTAKAAPAVVKEHDAAYASLPFWAELSGSFDLDINAMQFAPYRIDHVRGRLDATDTTLSLHDLGGEMFAGRWGGGLRIEHARGNTTGEHTLTGEFHIEQFESARVVQTVFPNQLASVDARINVHAKVASVGNSFVGLIDHSAAEFSVDGEKGVVRLTVPKADLVSTAAVFGGTVLLSPELRALGRLLKKFAEMPVDQIRITGRRDINGAVTLDEFRFESPQVRLLGHGRIPSDASQPLMNRPLELSLELAAKDELAVILGGMSLLDKKPRADGFRAMRQPFALGGRAGAPDTAPLYDLLAKAVSGSSGTWGFLMRKVQAEVEKKKTAAANVAP